ncbi:N-acetylmuramoyl-L-alanine amidase [Thalassomonas sp. M1454]|uniref:N-acetylmuramoyl-L-alanine amidase n=1 Tax=Thalassomonas sp. M1454 TaxID=2594477 RepID=UPI00117DF6EE|nr:N-acetylmuramoyl-L-alanine amidase [Thalassomonas sp. M1454]TRX57881.1 AMIN domain-containing protein [Thalassomonas sp. M1454]
MRNSSLKIVIFLLGLLAPNAWAINVIEGVRIWPAPENTRVVFDLSETPNYSYFFLQKPTRLVIDFKNAQNIVNLTNLAKNDKRIKTIRTSKTSAKGVTRIVLDLSQKYKEHIFPLPAAGPYGNRLVVDLNDTKRSVTASHKPKNNSRDVVIGIDAGHGGEDPGSISKNGTYEKKITLTIAKKLAKVINAEPGMKAVLIRTGDYFVNLNKRTQIAREKEVDFLVSIHADAFHTSQPRGASVWIVNNSRAQSELSRWLVNREKNSELLGGGGELIKKTNDEHLAVFIADLTKDKSLEISDSTARNVISELAKITKMHKREPQNASLAVLKSSDIPSMLVETGFISNPYDFKNLMSPTHQNKLASAVFKGIRRYFQQYPPEGSLFASRKPTKHKVSSGESLSVVAKRYKVSVKSLKLANNLKSDVVRIGQTLTIPRVN